MSFKEFDLTDYINALEDFKNNCTDTKYGSGAAEYIVKAFQYYSEKYHKKSSNLP